MKLPAVLLSLFQKVNSGNKRSNAVIRVGTQYTYSRVPYPWPFYSVLLVKLLESSRGGNYSQIKYILHAQSSSKFLSPKTYYATY